MNDEILIHYNITFSELYYKIDVASRLSYELDMFFKDSNIDHGIYINFKEHRILTPEKLKIPYGFNIITNEKADIDLSLNKVKEIEEKYKEYAYTKHSFVIKEAHRDIVLDILKDMKIYELMDYNGVSILHVFSKDKEYNKQLFKLGMIAK